MKTAKELMKIARERDDWKSLKLWTWAYDYEDKMTEWSNIFPPVNDDRRVYINKYIQVYDAINSLSDNPPEWVCVAINDELGKERKTMNEILARYKELAAIDASTYQSKTTTAPKKRNYRAPSKFDPVVMAIKSGETVLSEELAKLSIDELKDIVSEHGLDSTRCALKWNDRQRLETLIISVASRRAHRGDAFWKS